MIIYVDIDETICNYEKGNKHEERNYEKARPIIENIKKINKLYDEGNIIVYWTARGSLSGKDWQSLTDRQLKVWGAKYHECKTGKPVYDLFICDKAINSEIYFSAEK